MGRNCRADEYWDALLKHCQQCNTVCKQQQPQTITKCISYCVSAHCKALPGHYYDGLLKKCVRCAEVCGGPPAECSQHCQTPSPALEDSNVLLYSVLGLCMVMLLSSLSLTLAVFLSGAKAKTSKQRPKEANHTQELVVQTGQEIGQQGGQLEQSSKDFVTNSSHPTNCEPPQDSIPTETCVCIHCFPDPTALGQGNDRPLRAPFSFYQQAVLQQAQNQKGGPLWTEESLYTSGLKVQEEAAV